VTDIDMQKTATRVGTLIHRPISCLQLRETCAGAEGGGIMIGWEKLGLIPTLCVFCGN
jgi:hypothetical protein